MPNQQNKKYRIPILYNPWQVVGCLAAIGFAIAIHFGTDVQESYDLNAHAVQEIQVILRGFFIASIIIAAMNFALPKNFLFVAAIPMIYILVSGRSGFSHFSYFLLSGIGNEFLLFIAAGIVILCASAYVFSTPRTAFTLMILLLGTKIGLLVYRIVKPYIEYDYNIDSIKVTDIWEFIAAILLFASMAVTTYVIASGINEYIPSIDLVAQNRNQRHGNQHHTDTTEYSINSIDFTTLLPFIDSETIQNLGNSVDSGGLWTSNISRVGYDDISQGLFVMDSLAQNDSETLKHGFRRTVFNTWLSERYKGAMKNHISYKIMNPLLWISGPALVFMIVFQGKMVGANPLNLLIVFGIAIIPFFIFRRICTNILENFFRKPGNPVEREYSNLPESFFCKFAYDSVPCFIDANLDIICNSLNLDSSRFKVDLGRQSGGYTDFYHVGTGGFRITGTDAVFGTFSRIIAGSRNSAVNSRVSSLESLLYYNNVAAYFYTDILPKCDVSLLREFYGIEENTGSAEENIGSAEDNIGSAEDNSGSAKDSTGSTINTTANAGQALYPHNATQKNNAALVGFILSLVGVVTIIPLLGLPGIPGLICSIIGIATSNKYEKKKYKGLAIAGTVIGALLFIFTIYVVNFEGLDSLIRLLRSL